MHLVDLTPYTAKALLERKHLILLRGHVSYISDFVNDSLSTVSKSLDDAPPTAVDLRFLRHTWILADVASYERNAAIKYKWAQRRLGGDVAPYGDDRPAQRQLPGRSVKIATLSPVGRPRRALS